MKSANNFLVVTTNADISLPLLVDAASARGLHTGVLLFDAAADFSKKLAERQWDLVYLRDPFNTGNYDLAAIEQRLDMIVRFCPDAYFVDHAKSIEALLFEDKWRQYKELQSFMPPTAILRDASQFISGQHIIKKRIASRSKGVYFEVANNLLDGNCIVQPLLQLIREYRVFVVRGEVCATTSLRQSKAPGQKLTTLKTMPIPAAISRFAAEIAATSPRYDFLGLDIAELPDKQLVLLEANRSCQFKKFTQLSGVNPGDMLLDAIIQNTA